MVSLLSVDNKHEHLQPIMTKRQVYLGKSGFFFLLGIIQALIVSIGDLVILKASIESPILFVSIAVFSSLVFNSIIYTSVSLLGNPRLLLLSYLCYKLLVEEVHSQFKQRQNSSKRYLHIYHSRILSTHYVKQLEV